MLEKFAPEPEAPEASGEGDEKKDAPLSPERTAVLSDLHWLVHQGHVIEYANGQMEVAPKPQPPQQKKKKPKPEKKEADPAAEETKVETTPAEPERLAKRRPPRPRLNRRPSRRQRRMTKRLAKRKAPTQASRPSSRRLPRLSRPRRKRPHPLLSKATRWPKNLHTPPPGWTSRSATG